ncbi:hypothetical protein RSAG8_01746, partial [Rhizoctonia solani AG-8 WAC10335]
MPSLLKAFEVARMVCSKRRGGYKERVRRGWGILGVSLPFRFDDPQSGIAMRVWQRGVYVGREGTSRITVVVLDEEDPLDV